MKVRLIAATGAAGFAAAIAAGVGTAAVTSVHVAAGLPVPTPTPGLAIATPSLPGLPTTPPAPSLPPLPTAPLPMPTLPVPTPTLPVPTPTLPVPTPTLLPTPTPTQPTPPVTAPSPTPNGGGGNPTPSPTSAPGTTPSPSANPGPTPGPGGSGGGSNGGGSSGGGTTGGGTTGGTGGSAGGPTITIPNGGGGTLSIPQAINAAASTRSGHAIQPGAIVTAGSMQSALDELTLAVSHATSAPGGSDAFTVTLTVAGNRVPDAQISMSLISSPGQDANISPQTGYTDANGVLQGVLHLSSQPGDHLLLAWSGAYSDEVHVMGVVPAAAGGGGLPFGLSHLGILRSPVVLWLAAVTGAVVLLGVLVNLGLLRRKGMSISVRRLLARRRAARIA
ncbi:MAG: hypothetical protein JO198_10445 [Candidatus Dormibacteraeota bacterium]|nr:hypothetical protein [Candidatus Dormibacteraeota bacterium]